MNDSKLFRAAETIINCVPGSVLKIWGVYQKSLAHHDYVNRFEAESGIDLVEIGPDQSALLQMVDKKVKLRMLDKRWRVGNRCYVGKLKNEPVFYSWVFANKDAGPIDLNQVTPLKADLILPSRWIYIWDVCTKSSHRGHGLMPLFIQDICRQFAAVGYDEAVALVSMSNRSSKKAVAKIGFAQTHRICHFRFLKQNLILDHVSLEA